MYGYSLYNSLNFSICLKFFIIKCEGSLAGAGQRAMENDRAWDRSSHDGGSVTCSGFDLGASAFIFCTHVLDALLPP